MKSPPRKLSFCAAGRGARTRRGDIPARDKKTSSARGYLTGICVRRVFVSSHEPAAALRGAAWLFCFFDYNPESKQSPVHLRGDHGLSSLFRNPYPILSDCNNLLIGR